MSSISDIPRQELCILISTYGRGLCDDPQRCEALLRDYCGSHRREIMLLVNAIKEQIPSELTASVGKVPYEILRSRLAKKLEENLAITADAAQWTVDAWAAALEISTPAASNSGPISSRPPDGTRMEAYPSAPPQPSTPPYQPTEVSGGFSGVPSGTPGGMSGQGSAPTQLRPISGMPQDAPSAQPNYAQPNDAQPNYAQPNYAQPPAVASPKTNGWLIGGIVGASVVGLGALGILLAVLGGSGSAEMRAALKEAKRLRADKEFSECINKLKEFETFDEAKEEAHGCHLDLAKEFADKGELIEAIDEAKLITEAPNADIYQEAKNLVAEWSKGKEIKIFNDCAHPVEIALRFADPSDPNFKDKPDGWWKLDAGKRSFLSDKGQRIRVLNPVLFYAQATDDSGLKWEGNIRVVLNDTTYQMQTLDPEVDPEDGSLKQTLTCNSK